MFNKQKDEYLLGYYLKSIGDHAVTFLVEEQEDRLTNYVKYRGSFQASNGWRVQIHRHPDIDTDKKIIFLQGKWEEMDDRVTVIEGLKSKERKKLISAIRAALEEVSAAAKKWTPKQSVGYVEVLTIEPLFYDPFDVFSRKHPFIVIKDKGSR